MSTSQLGIYNIALAALGERSLDSLAEDGEPLRELNQAWSRDKGIIAWALEQGMWQWSFRTVEMDADTSLTSGFGYNYVFAIPDDFVTLDMLSANESFDPPLLDYEEEAGNWLTYVTPLYVRYISSDASYGADMSQWPPSFSEWLGHVMACRIAKRYLGAKDIHELERKTLSLLSDARMKAGSRGPSRFPPLGSWTRARTGWSNRHGDRGRRDRLTGG